MRIWRRRWVRRGAVALPLLAAVAAVGLVGYSGATRSSDRGRLNALRAKLDATDPGWRLEELLVAREAAFPPDERNPVLHANRAKSLAPKAYQNWQLRAFRGDRPGGNWVDETELNLLPWDEDLADAACARYEALGAIDEARKLKGMTTPGGVRLAITPDVIGTLLPHVQNTREAAALLQLDANVSAALGDPDRAIDSAHACLVLSAGIGDEPTLISMLVRIAIAAIAKNAVERTLAWGEPAAGLAELQAVFQAEGDAKRFLLGIRGERAMSNRLFDNLHEGVLNLNQFIGAVGMLGGGTKLLDRLRLLQYRAHVYGDHADMLDALTQYVEIAKTKPRHLQLDAYKRVPIPNDPLRNMLTRLLLPACEKVAEADHRCAAQMRCAAVAIACERFRQKAGRWPESLREIPADILAAVPDDPYAGGPIRYAVVPGGAVVYSAGKDKADDGGNVSARGEDGTDYGFVLWDADRRRRPRPHKPDNLLEAVDQEGFRW